MTENEVKAIKWMKSVRDDAVVTLDHIAKYEPNVSPMLYAGRKEKAEGEETKPRGRWVFGRTSRVRHMDMSELRKQV